MSKLTIAQIDALLAAINEVAVDTDWSIYGLPFYPRGEDASDVKPRRELRRAVSTWYAGIVKTSAAPRRVRSGRLGQGRPSNDSGH